MATIDRKCDNCGRTYKADTRNLKRGWGRCCCKSCAAQLRERSKPGFTGESTIWKLVHGITAHSRELEPRIQRDLQEIAGDLMNRVKL